MSNETNAFTAPSAFEAKCMDIIHDMNYLAAALKRFSEGHTDDRVPTSESRKLAASIRTMHRLLQSKLNDLEDELRVIDSYQITVEDWLRANRTDSQIRSLYYGFKSTSGTDHDYWCATVDKLEQRRASGVLSVTLDNKQGVIAALQIAVLSYWADKGLTAI